MKNIHYLLTTEPKLDRTMQKFGLELKFAQIGANSNGTERKPATVQKFGQTEPEIRTEHSKIRTAAVVSIKHEIQQNKTGKAAPTAHWAGIGSISAKGLAAYLLRMMN